MSNPNTAEDIVRRIVQRENSCFGMRNDGASMLKDAMQEHTNQTLDRLREKVKGLREETIDTIRICKPDGRAYERNDSRQHTLSVVLNLIEEVSDA